MYRSSIGVHRMPILSDLGLAAVLTAIAYFIALGILLVFVDRIPVARFLGIALGLEGIALGLVVIDEAGVGAIAVALLAALATDQALETIGAE